MNNIVLAASQGYIQGVTAFLNSFQEYHDTSKYKVHLLSLDLKENFSNGWTKQVQIDINEHEQYGRSNPWGTKIPRFKYAANVDGVVMLADADMFFCGNIDHWFDFAELGYIIAGSNGSNFGFNQGWRDKYSLPQLPDFYNYKTITSVPTVLKTSQHGDLWKSVHEHKLTIETGGDFDLQNIYAVINDKFKWIVPVPAQQVTGIHHFMLKPDTGVMRKAGKLVTRDGLEVLMVHGKWWSKGWYDNLMVHMKRYAKGNEKTISMAEHSRKELKQEFDRWSNANV